MRERGEGRSSVGDHRYLIIGGTTKAATTSLFYYLADHPQVCAASRKETRFFLDRDYTPQSLYHMEDGLARYGLYFGHCGDAAVRVEATPEYLYCPGTAEKIHQSLPKAQMLFVLREPASRLFSWHRYAKQIGLMPSGMTFEEYVESQFRQGDSLSLNMRTLEQGRYVLYLKPFIEVFGRDRVSVVFYEDVARDAKSVLKEICRYAGIDPGFYEDYTFQVFGRTKAMRSVGLHKKIISLRQFISAASINRPKLYLRLRKLWLAIEPLYAHFNVVKAEEAVRRETLLRLREYYGPYDGELTSLIGRALPWDTRDRVNGTS
ncbi:MAG: sulfotransferase domain-containing protein [Thermodesulfovibrionales bacterium]